MLKYKRGDKMKAEASMIVGIVALAAIVGVIAYTQGWLPGGWTWYGQDIPTAGCWMRSEITCQGDSEHSDNEKVIVGDHILVSRAGRGFDAILPEDGYDACQVQIDISLNNVNQGHAIAHGDYVNMPFSYAAGTPYGSCRVNNRNVPIAGKSVSQWSQEGAMIIETVTFYDYVTDPDPEIPPEEFECVVASDCDWYCSQNECNTPTCLGEWTCVKDDQLRGECVFECYEPEDVECYSDANCPMGYICHDNECMPAMEPDTSCYTNAECSTGYICDLNTNTCVEEPDPGSVFPPGGPITEENLPWIIGIALVVIGAAVVLGSRK